MNLLNSGYLCQPMNEATQHKYLRYWSEFVDLSGINTDIQQPTKELFLSFFREKRKAKNCSGKTQCGHAIPGLVRPIDDCKRENLEGMYDFRLSLLLMLDLLVMLSGLV